MPIIPPSTLPHLIAETVKYKPTIEIRERFDRRVERDFNYTIPDGRSAFESRYRLGAEITFNKDVSGKVVYQYGHSLFWTDGRNFSDEHSDLYVGQIDLKLNKGMATVGRQIFKKGDNRLFEESNFSQRSKSYDGFRMRNGNLDLFAAKVGFSGNPSDQARVFVGAYKWRLGETMAIYKHDAWVSQQSFWTIDHRYDATWGDVKFGAEGALQFGRTGSQDLRSYWFHARAEKPISSKTKVFVEGNIASGGTDGNTSNLFDPLFGQTHNPYGLMDVQGLRNLNHLELGVQHAHGSRTNFQLSANWFNLNDPTDGWYGTNGRINSFSGGQFVDPTGTRGRDIGWELDFSARYNLSSRDFLQLELGAFFPGRFVRSFLGGNETNQYWGLLTYQLKM